MKTIKTKCPNCGSEHTFKVSDEQFTKYLEHVDNIQNIFPEMRPEYREMLISGICPKCWKEIFGKNKKNH